MKSLLFLLFDAELFGNTVSCVCLAPSLFYFRIPFFFLGSAYAFLDLLLKMEYSGCEFI